MKKDRASLIMRKIQIKTTGIINANKTDNTKYSYTCMNKYNPL